MQDKLYGLSKFWQEANYNFAYFDQVSELDWESEFKDAIVKVTQTSTDYDYYRILQSLAVKLKDGHTQVYFPDYLNNEVGSLPIHVFREKDEYVITNIAVDLEKSIPVGTRIIEINQLAVADYISQYVAPYIASSTVHAKNKMVLDYLFVGLKKEEVSITFQLETGKKVTKSLSRNNDYGPLVHKPYLTDNYSLKKMNKFVYVNLHSFEHENIVSEFASDIPRINKSKGLVLDLRKNIGGQSVVGLNIAKYLVQNDKILDMPWRSRQHIASLKAWGNSGLHLVGYEAVNEYKGFGDMNEWITVDSDVLELPADREKVEVPIVILMNEHTASAAENFLIYALQDESIITVGQPSFGSTGQPIYFSLPGNGIARICAKQNFNIDGTEFVGIGIQPHVFVAPTLESEIKQQDLQLEEAMRLLKSMDN